MDEEIMEQILNSLNLIAEIGYARFKNNKKKTITLRTYEDGLIKVYEKYGFEKSKDENNLMIKKL